MNNAGSSGAAFFAELRRRRVLHIGGAYIAGAWLGTEILSFLLEQFNAPHWAYRMLAIGFVVGFPISMVLAWVIQIDEDGHWALDPSHGDYRTLAIAIGVGLLATAALSWVILPQREPPPAYEPLPVSLAVLPFVHPGATPNEQAAAGTLYRNLMQWLERSDGLTLVRLGRGAPPADRLAFGRDLGIAALAWGRFGNSNAGVRVEMTMLDVVTGEIAWSQSYPWEPTRIVELANDLADGLLQAMSLPPLERQSFTGTDSRQAYEAYLAGEQYAADPEGEQLRRAVEEFERALELDPGYTQAHVALAQAIYDLLDTVELSAPEREGLQRRAQAAVDFAQRVDPESADAMSLLGLGLENRQLRIQAFERALELDPDHDLSYYRYAVQMREDGYLEDADRLIRQAIRLRPMSARYRLELAEILAQQGRQDESRSEREKARAFQWPGPGTSPR